MPKTDERYQRHQQGHGGKDGHHGGRGHDHGHGGHDHHQEHHRKAQHHGHRQAGAHRRQAQHPHGHKVTDDHGHSHTPTTVDVASAGEERDPAANAADPVAPEPWAPEPPQHRPERRGGIIDALLGAEPDAEPAPVPSVPELLTASGREAHPYNDPQHVTFRGSFLCPTPTATFLMTGQPNGPGPGRIWHVRALRAVGGLPVANAGDSAAFHFFVGPDPGAPADGDIADAWRDWTSTNTSPVQADYGRHEFVVRYPNLIYVLVTGGTAGRVYTFTGLADDELALLPAGSRETVSW